MKQRTVRLSLAAIVCALWGLSLWTVGMSIRARAAAAILDAKDPVGYFIADGGNAPGFRVADRQLALWALEAWERSSAKAIRFEQASESAAVVRLYWAQAQDGQYGEMRPLMVGGRAGAAVYIRPDVDGLGEEIARRARADDLFRDSIVYLTCLHELGHALGLAHTSDFRDIMYFFGYGGNVGVYFNRYRAQLHTKDDIASVSGLSEADISRLRTMYPRKMIGRVSRVLLPRTPSPSRRRSVRVTR